MLTPLVPVSRAVKVALGSAFFALFVLLWAAATLGGFVNRTFLADPVTMLLSGWRLLTVHGFYEDIGVTIWRVMGGFAIAALIGVPLGIFMGAYKAMEMATIDGARACLWDDEIGSLEAGKRADIIVIGMNDIRWHPNLDPVRSLA